MVAIIDYDAGNLKSVQKAFEFLGADVVVTRKRNEILNSDHVILPGVGAFGEAMEKLEQYDLVDTIKEVVKRKIPLLGICLGMQLLFESSEESDGVKGLSLLEGKIVKIPKKEGIKIPHMGWNSLELKGKATLFQGLSKEPYVYFVHSYYLVPSKAEDVVAVTEYGTNLSVAVEHENLFGCQFHPEKSGEVGLEILKNFLKVSK
ncbi:MAG: imidazole glycerol phosphate synthase subunit HisH [Clostridiales bacterium]|nr:imidazole glycerol phosphate synthase subunit HisH [Clostridiales bacterium]